MPSSPIEYPWLIVQCVREMLPDIRAFRGPRYKVLGSRRVIGETRSDGLDEGERLSSWKIVGGRGLKTLKGRKLHGSESPWEEPRDKVFYLQSMFLLQVFGASKNPNFVGIGSWSCVEEEGLPQNS